jgi:hypothetical protein
VALERVKHKAGFILLEDVVVGVCDACGSRYYTADVLHAVHEAATGGGTPQRRLGASARFRDLIAERRRQPTISRAELDRRLAPRRPPEPG